MPDNPTTNEDRLTRGERRRIERKVKGMDEKFLSPNERAEIVLSVLAKATGVENAHDLTVSETSWDLVCFCVEFFNQFSARLGEDFEPLARVLNNMIYAMHYNHGEEFLERSREQALDYWQPILDALDTLDTPEHS